MRLLLSLAAVATLAGCGPIQSTSALLDADVELEAARAAGAEAAAPYEYTAAEAYLHKAREEAGYAQYEASAELATRARDLARAAKQKATGTATRGEAP